jgi:hypothetical protein
MNELVVATVKLPKSLTQPLTPLGHPSLSRSSQILQFLLRVHEDPMLNPPASDSDLHTGGTGNLHRLRPLLWPQRFFKIIISLTASMLFMFQVMSFSSVDRWSRHYLSLVAEHVDTGQSLSQTKKLYFSRIHGAATWAICKRRGILSNHCSRGRS